MINWLKYRWLYLLISGTVLIFGILGILKWGLKFGVDFTGGIVAEYQFPDGRTQIVRHGSLLQQEYKKDRENFESQGAKEVRYELVGPTIGPELVQKTVTALLISAGIILMWVTYQFRSFKFGVSAVLATMHDSLVLVGSFAIFGHFFGAEVDFLFVTAILTILSFSVHDTIVVYDRIRESQKKLGGSIHDLANTAISQTMVRSLNNSFTIIFMLLALILMGGETIKWFAVALLVGTISGTYSSPFVAVPILVTWDEILIKINSRKTNNQV